MNQAQYTQTHAPVDVFPWLPTHVVEESWAWYRAATSVDLLIGLTLRGQLPDPEQVPVDYPVPEVARRLSTDQVAAWLVLTGLAAQVVELTVSADGPLPSPLTQHHWQADPDYLATNMIRPHPGAPTPIDLALTFINDVTAGQKPEPLLDHGAPTIIATFCTLVHLLARLHAGRPALRAADGPPPHTTRRRRPHR